MLLLKWSGGRLVTRSHLPSLHGLRHRHNAVRPDHDKCLYSSYIQQRFKVTAHSQKRLPKDMNVRVAERCLLCFLMLHARAGHGYTAKVI